MNDLTNHINGCGVAPESGKYLDNVDPATGEVCGRVPASDAADVEAAVAAAVAAASRCRWRRRSTFRAAPPIFATSPPQFCTPRRNRTISTAAAFPAASRR
jgi:hypothetical protein